MYTRMPLQTFELHCHVKQLCYIWFILIHFLQVWTYFQSHRKSDIFYARNLVRNCLCNLITQTIWKCHRTTDVAHTHLCCHRTESDNLDNLFLAVFLYDVINDFLSSVDTEININIWHRYTFRIQESFKQQIVPKRLDIRNIQTIGYN